MKVSIAILGLGVVGGGVYELITKNASSIEHKTGLTLEIKKTLSLEYSVPVPDEIKAANIDEIMGDPEISVVVELMGGKTVAREYCLAALNAKKSVVTANKELVANYWGELEAAAAKNGVGLYFEASVGGGIPILRSVVHSLQANRVTSIFAILNGTTNYILSKMTADGRDFGDVLSEAQKLGYAETDATADVEAFDAMNKLSILSSMAFHVRLPVELIYREGISKITSADIDFAKSLGMVIKLLAIGKKNGELVELRVHPTLIPSSHPLASVNGAFNAVYLSGDNVGDLMFYGQGAGAGPTASAVVSDIVNGARATDHDYMTFMNVQDKLSPTLIINDDFITGFFARIRTLDKPGVLHDITGVFAKHQISVKSVLQSTAGGSAEVIFITHKTKEKSMMAAVDEIDCLRSVIGVESLIRVED